MSEAKQETTRITPDYLSDSDYELGCSVLASSVRRFFEQPGVREEYEAWLKSEENGAD